MPTTGSCLKLIPLPEDVTLQNNGINKTDTYPQTHLGEKNWVTTPIPLATASFLDCSIVKGRNQVKKILMISLNNGTTHSHKPVGSFFLPTRTRHKWSFH